MLCDEAVVDMAQRIYERHMEAAVASGTSGSEGSLAGSPHGRDSSRSRPECIIRSAYEGPDHAGEHASRARDGSHLRTS